MSKFEFDRPVQFSKSLLLNGFRLDLKVESFKTTVKKVRSHKICGECGERAKFKPFCSKCGDIKSVKLSANLNKIKDDQPLEPRNIKSYAPLTKTAYAKAYVFPVDYSVYNLLPYDNNELPYSAIHNYLSQSGKVLPVDFRHNSNSVTRSGYIESYQNRLILHVLLAKSEISRVREPLIIDVEQGMIKKVENIFNGEECEIKDFFAENDLVKKEAVVARTQNEVFATMLSPKTKSKQVIMELRK